MIEQIPIPELESRMRPGAWSEVGFLGEAESLRHTIGGDAHTLDKLGVGYDHIADALGTLLKYGIDYYPQWWRDEQLYERLTSLARGASFPLNKLPAKNRGYSTGTLQIFTLAFKGVQDCPWGCGDIEIPGSYDFLLLDRTTGELIPGPSLIVHLIRVHHFFEGKASPYRVDPEKLVRILRL